MRVLGTGTEADEPLTMSAAAKELAELMRQYRSKGWGPVEEGGPPGFVQTTTVGLCQTCRHFKQDHHKYSGPPHSSDCGWKQRGVYPNARSCAAYKAR